MVRKSFGCVRVGRRLQGKKKMDVGAVAVIAGAIHWLLGGYRKVVTRAMPPRA